MNTQRVWKYMVIINTERIKKPGIVQGAMLIVLLIFLICGSVLQFRPPAGNCAPPGLLKGIHRVAAPDCEQEINVTAVVAKAGPSMVTIIAFNEEKEILGYGVGFVIRKDGVIATSYQALQGATQVRVRTASGKVYLPSGVIKIDKNLDLVILKIPVSDYVPVILEEHVNIRVGASLVAVGALQGEGRTVAAGVLGERRLLDDVSMLQHNVDLPAGSSGTPLFNMQGNVVGINTTIQIDGQALNFAIPSSYIQSSLKNNDVVRYTVADVAAWEKRITRDSTRSWRAGRFTQYRDNNGAFNLYFPTDWSIRKKTEKHPGSGVFQSFTIFGPEPLHPEAASTPLEKGVRVMIEVPHKGVLFNINTTAGYGDLLRQAIESENPNFHLLERSWGNLADVPVLVYQFSGVRAGEAEQRIASYVVFANEEVRGVIELVSPSTKMETLNQIFGVMLETFRFGH